ncbi:hypothetical protein [Candidatus Vidania fulgoroideorum]
MKILNIIIRKKKENLFEKRKLGLIPSHFVNEAQLFFIKNKEFDIKEKYYLIKTLNKLVFVKNISFFLGKIIHLEFEILNGNFNINLPIKLINLDSSRYYNSKYYLDILIRNINVICNINKLDKFVKIDFKKFSDEKKIFLNQLNYIFQNKNNLLIVIFRKN